MAPQASGSAFAVEDFVQNLTAQLDRAQDALALKAQTGRPLTFALKDLSVELKVFWEVQRDGRLLVRHASPNEQGASTVHLAFTSITRAMVEENTFSLALDEDTRTLRDLGGKELLDDEERRKLDMLGVRTVGQFKRLDPAQTEAIVGIPVNRLRAALEKSARPAVTGNRVERRPGRHLLRIQGANLMKDEPPKVRLSGDPVEVLEASATELLVRPLSVHREGQFEIEVEEGEVATGFYELPPQEGAA